jgi:para-aminobenzoate synthetase component 1
MPAISTVELDYRVDSGDFFARIKDLPDAIWLDSGQPLAVQGRYDILSASPDCIIETYGELSTITDAGGARRSTQDPFTLTSELLAPLSTAPLGAHVEPFVGGIIGYFGYDLGRRYHRVERPQQMLTSLPDMRIGRYLWALLIDHQERSATLCFHPICPVMLRRTVTETLCVKHTTASSIESTPFSCQPFVPQISKSEYLCQLEKVKQYIDAGDCYQVNFAHNFNASYSGDTFGAYRALRKSIPSPYSAYWQWHDKCIMSLSPERFLRIHNNRIETKPIKGTIERGKTGKRDRRNAEALLNSGKDRAENLMIVDLLRNDLGKNARIGSVGVPKLFALESFANVHHLVSTVTAEIAADKTPMDVLRDSFPGGSITGAPKLRAMQIIQQLEAVNRSVYCGSVGYISADLSMDTNIAIRTVVGDGNHLHCWGGGGIVADSIANDEYAESVAKIKIIMETLENY